MYFLTDLDPNADVKGSRDPLGLQPIWSALGRRVVAHLTTVTTSLRGFSVLLLGLEMAERAAQSSLSIGHEARERERLACFLRFEQLAAYSRFVTYQGDERLDIRGINRVKRRLNEEGTVYIGAADQHQILSEQRTYGLWGLYMSAARGSGLVEDSDARLTPHARAFVEKAYLGPLRGDVVGELLKRVRDEGRGFDPRGRDRTFARRLGELLGPRLSSAERDFFSRSLVEVENARDPTRGNQRSLWKAMVQRSAAGGFDWYARSGFADVAAFRECAQESEALAAALDAVLALEPLLAVAGITFDHLVGRRRSTLTELARGLEREWGTGALRFLRTDGLVLNRASIEDAADADTADRLAASLEAFRQDRFEDAIERLLDQNDAVMRARGAAGWVERSRGELRARLFQNPFPLPPSSELRMSWRNSYFIDALRHIGAEIYFPRNNGQ